MAASSENTAMYKWNEMK